MRYSRFELGFTRNKKVHSFSDGAFRLWVSSIDHAREQKTNGKLDESDLDLIPCCPRDKESREALVNELVAKGGWEKTRTGWQVHDFLDWQDAAEVVEKKLADARQRMRSVRSNKTRTFDEQDANVRHTFSERSREHTANTSRTFRERSRTDHDPIRSSDLSAPDPDQPDRSGSDGGQPPFDLKSALAMPIQARSKACQRDRLGVGQFCCPADWPEVQKFAEAVGKALGWRVVLGSFPKDAGVSAAVELYAAGYSVDDLVRAAEISATNDWFKADKRRRVLSSFTPKVVAMLLAERGAQSATVAKSPVVVNGSVDRTEEVREQLRKALEG